MTPASKKKIYFGHNGPRNEHATPEPAQQFGCEKMTLPLVAIQRRDDRACVADN